MDSEKNRQLSSTKKLLNSEAIPVGTALEKCAREGLPEDTKTRQRIFRRIEDAADLTLSGTLTESATQGIFSRIMDAWIGAPLRHSLNSAMANAGVSEELRQRLAGHAAKAVNNSCNHTDLKTLRKAVELVPSVAPDRVHFTGGIGTPGESGPPSGTEAKDLIK